MRQSHAQPGMPDKIGDAADAVLAAGLRYTDRVAVAETERRARRESQEQLLVDGRKRQRALLPEYLACDGTSVFRIDIDGAAPEGFEQYCRAARPEFMFRRRRAACRTGSISPRI